MKNIFTICLAVFLITSCNSTNNLTKDGKVLLQINPKKNTEYDTVMGMDITTKVQGLEVGIIMNMHYDVLVTDLASNGDISTSNTFSRIVMDMDAMGMTIEYDSEDEDRDFMAEQIHSTVEPLIGYEAMMKVTSKGEVIESPDFSNAFDPDSPMAAQFKNTQSTFNNIAVILPETAVGIGDSWDSSYTVDTDGSELEYDVNYTIKEITKENIVVDLSGVVSDHESGENIGDLSGQSLLDSKTHWTTKSDVVVNLAMNVEDQDIEVSSKINFESTPK